MYGKTIENETGFWVYKSKDLEEWSKSEKVFTPPMDFWADRDFWAPEVHQYKGKFYMFASFKAENRCRATQILVSDAPDEQFVPLTDRPITPTEWECLDGTLYVDKKGKPHRGASKTEESDVFLTQENRDTVRRAAEECAVLLKNDGILPLSKDIKKIALIGPFADNHNIIGFWSCNGRNEESVTVYEGIKNLLPDAEITVVKGCSDEWDDYDTSEFDKAVNAAKDADAVIFCLVSHRIIAARVIQEWI